MNMEDGFHKPPAGFIPPSFITYSTDTISDSPPDLSNVLDSTQWILDFAFSNTSIDTSKLKHLVQALTTTSRLRGKFAYLLFDKVSNQRDQTAILKYIIPLLNLSLDKCSRFDLIKPNVFSLSAPTFARFQSDKSIVSAPRDGHQFRQLLSPHNAGQEVAPTSFLSPLFHRMTLLLIHTSTLLITTLQAIEHEIEALGASTLKSVIPLSALTQLTHQFLYAQDSTTRSHPQTLSQTVLHGLEHISESYLRLRGLSRNLNRIYDLTRQLNTYEGRFLSLLYFLYKHAVCRSNISRTEASNWITSFICELLKLCLPLASTIHHNPEDTHHQPLVDNSAPDISELLTQQCQWLYALTRVVNFDRMNVHNELNRRAYLNQLGVGIASQLSSSRSVNATLSSVLTMTILLKYGDLTISEEAYEKARDLENRLSKTELVRDEKNQQPPYLPAPLLSTVWQTYTFIIATLLTIPQNIPPPIEIDPSIVYRTSLSYTPFFPTSHPSSELTSSPLAHSSSLPSLSASSRFDFPQNLRLTPVQIPTQPSHVNSLNQPLSPPLSLSQGQRNYRHHHPHLSELTSPLTHANSSQTPFFPALPSPYLASPMASGRTRGKVLLQRQVSQPLSPFRSLNISSPLLSVSRRADQDGMDDTQKRSVFSFGAFSPQRRSPYPRNKLSDHMTVTSPTFTPTINEEHRVFPSGTDDDTYAMTDSMNDAQLSHQLRPGIGSLPDLDHGYTPYSNYYTKNEETQQLFHNRDPEIVGTKLINEYSLQFSVPNVLKTKRLYFLRVSSALPQNVYPRVTYQVVVSSTFDNIIPQSPTISISSRFNETSSRSSMLHLLLALLKKRLVEIYRLYCCDFRILTLIEKEQIRLEQLEKYYYDPSYINEWNGTTSAHCHAKLYNHIPEAPRSYYLNHIEDTSLYCTQFNQQPISIEPPLTHDPFQTPPQSPKHGGYQRLSPTRLSAMSPLKYSVFFPSPEPQHVSRLHSPPLSPLSSRYTVNDGSSAQSPQGRSNRPHSPHFSLLSPTSHSSFLSALRVGNYIDAKDSHHVWYMAKIIEMAHDSMTVHYDGWSSSYDEIIDKTMWRYRVAPLGSVVTEQSRRRKNESLLFDMEIVLRNLPKWEPPVTGPFPFIGISSPTLSASRMDQPQLSPPPISSTVSSPPMAPSGNERFPPRQSVTTQPNSGRKPHHSQSFNKPRIPNLPSSNESRHEVLRKHIIKSREMFQKVSMETKERLQETFPIIENVFTQIVSVCTLSGALLAATPLDDYIINTIQWLCSVLHFSVLNHGCLGGCSLPQVYDTVYAIPEDSALLPHLLELEKLEEEFLRTSTQNEISLFAPADLSHEFATNAAESPFVDSMMDESKSEGGETIDKYQLKKPSTRTCSHSNQIEKKAQVLQSKHFTTRTHQYDDSALSSQHVSIDNHPSFEPEHAPPHDPYCNLQKTYLGGDSNGRTSFDHYQVYVPPALYQFIANLVCSTILGASRSNQLLPAAFGPLRCIMLDTLELLSHLSDSGLWISSQIRLTNHLLSYNDTPDEKAQQITRAIQTPDRSSTQYDPPTLQPALSGTLERQARSFLTPQQHLPRTPSPQLPSAFSPGDIQLEDLPHPTVVDDDGHDGMTVSQGSSDSGSYYHQSDMDDLGDIADLPEVSTIHQARVQPPAKSFQPFFNTLSYQLSKPPTDFYGESFAFITVGDDPSSVICSRRDIQRLILETLRDVIVEAHPTQIGQYMRLVIQSHLIPRLVSTPDVLQSLLTVFYMFPQTVHRQLCYDISISMSDQDQEKHNTTYEPTAASAELPILHKLYPQMDMALDVFSSFRPLLQPGVTVKAFLPPQLDPVTAQVLAIDYAEQTVCVKYLDSIPDLDVNQPQQTISKPMSDHYLPISCIVPITDRPSLQQHNLDLPEFDPFFSLVEKKVRDQIAFIMNVPQQSITFTHNSLTYFLLQSITCSLLIHHAICHGIFSGAGLQQKAYHLREPYQITSLTMALMSSLQIRLFSCFTSLSKNIDLIDCLETSIQIEAAFSTGNDSPSQRAENPLSNFIRILPLDHINNIHNLPGSSLFQKFILIFPSLEEIKIQTTNHQSNADALPSDLDDAVGNHIVSGREECPLLSSSISQAISISFDGHIVSRSTRPPRLLSLLPAVSLPYGSLDLDIILLRAPVTTLPMPELQDINPNWDKLGIAPVDPSAAQNVPNILTIPPLIPHIHHLPKLPRDRFIATLPVTPMINAANSVIPTSTAPFPTPLDATMRDVASGAFVRERMIASRFSKKLSISATLTFNLSDAKTSDPSLFSRPNGYDPTLPIYHPQNHSMFTKIVNNYVESRWNNILIGTHVKLSPKATAAIQQILCGFNATRPGVIVDVYHCQLSHDATHLIPVQVRSPEVHGLHAAPSTASHASMESVDPALFSPSVRPTGSQPPASPIIPSLYTRRKSLLLAAASDDDYAGTSAHDYIQSTLNIIEAEQSRKPGAGGIQMGKPSSSPKRALETPPFDSSRSDSKYFSHKNAAPPTIPSRHTKSQPHGPLLKPSSAERQSQPLSYDEWGLPQSVPVTTGVGCVLVHFPPMLPDNTSILNSAFESSNRNSTLARLLNNFELQRQNELGLYTRIDDVASIISQQMHIQDGSSQVDGDEEVESSFSRLFLNDRGSLFVWLRLNDVEPLSEKQSPYMPELYLSSTHDFLRTAKAETNSPLPFGSTKEVVDLNEYTTHLSKESRLSRAIRHIQFIVRKRPQSFMHVAASQYRHTLCLFRSWMLSQLGIGHDHKFGLDRSSHHYKFLQRVLFGGYAPIIDRQHEHPYFQPHAPLLTIPRLLKILPTTMLPSEILDHSSMPESFRDRIPHKKETYLVPTSLSPRLDNILTLTTTTGRDNYPYNINGLSPHVPAAIKFLSQLLLMQTRVFRAPLYHQLPQDEMIGEWSQFEEYVDPFASDDEDENGGLTRDNVTFADMTMAQDSIIGNAYMAAGSVLQSSTDSHTAQDPSQSDSQLVPVRIIATPIDDMYASVSRACYDLLHWFTHPGVTMNLISFNKLAIRLRVEFKPMVIPATSIPDQNDPSKTITMPSSTVSVSHMALSFSHEFTKKSCLIRVYRNRDFSSCVNDIHFTTASETSPSTIIVPSPCYIQYTLLDEDFIQVQNQAEEQTTLDGDIIDHLIQPIAQKAQSSTGTSQTIRHVDPPFYHMFPETSSIHGSAVESQIHLYYLPSFVLNNISLAPYPPHCLNVIHACLQSVIALSGRPGISAYYRTKLHSLILLIIETLTACGLNDYLLTSAIETRYNNVSTSVNPLFEILRTRSENISHHLAVNIDSTLTKGTTQHPHGLSKDQQRALNQMLGEIIPQFSSLCAETAGTHPSTTQAEPTVSSLPFPIYRNDPKLGSPPLFKHAASSSQSQKHQIFIAHKIQHLLSQSLTTAGGTLHFALGISPTRSAIVKLLSKALFSITSVPVPLQTPPLLAFKHHFRQCQWVYTNSSSNHLKTFPAALTPHRRSLLSTHGQRISLQHMNSLPIRKPASPQSTSKLREGGITQGAPLVHPLFRLRDNIFVEFSNQLEFESSRGQSLIQRRQPVHIKGHLCPFVLFKSKITECLIEFVSAMEYALSSPWGQVNYLSPPIGSPFYQQNTRPNPNEDPNNKKAVEYEFISWFHQCSLHVQLWQAADGTWYKYSPDDFHTFNHFLKQVSTHTVPLSEDFFCLATDNTNTTFFCLVDNDLTVSSTPPAQRVRVENKLSPVQHIPFLNQGKGQSNAYSFLPLSYQLSQSIVHRRMIRTIPLYHYSVLRQSPSLVARLFMSFQRPTSTSDVTLSSSQSSSAHSTMSLSTGSSSRIRPSSSSSASSRFVHPSVIEGTTSFFLPSPDSLLYFLSRDDYAPQGLEDQINFLAHLIMSNMARRELQATSLSSQLPHLMSFIQLSSFNGLNSRNDAVVAKIMTDLYQRLHFDTSSSSSRRPTYTAKTNPIFNRIHHASSMIRHGYYRTIPPILLTLYTDGRFLPMPSIYDSKQSVDHHTIQKPHAQLLGLRNYELLPPDEAYNRRKAPAVGDDALVSLTETDSSIQSDAFNFPINDPYLSDACQQPIIDSACMVDLSFTSSIRIPFMYLRHPVIMNETIVEPSVSLRLPEGGDYSTTTSTTISLDSITAKLLMPHISRRMLLFDLNLLASGRIAPDQTPVVKLEVPLELDNVSALSDVAPPPAATSELTPVSSQDYESVATTMHDLSETPEPTVVQTPPMLMSDSDVYSPRLSPDISFGHRPDPTTPRTQGSTVLSPAPDMISLISNFFPGVVSETLTHSLQQDQMTHPTPGLPTALPVLDSASPSITTTLSHESFPTVESPSTIIRTLEEPDLPEVLDNMLFNTLDSAETLQYPDPLPTALTSPTPEGQGFGFTSNITQEDDRHHDLASLIEPLIVQLSRRLRESRNHHLRVLSGSYALRVIYSGLSNIGAVGFPGPFRQVLSQTLAQLNRISMIPHIIDQSVAYTEKILHMNYVDIYNENLDWYALEQSLSNHPGSQKASNAQNSGPRMRQMGEDLPQLFVSVANGLNNIGSNRDHLVPNSTAAAAGVMHLFMTLGLILGMGIRTKTSLDCNFPAAFWTMLTDTAPRGEYEEEEMLLRFGLLPLYQRSLISIPSPSTTRRTRYNMTRMLWDIIPFHANLNYSYYQDIITGTKGHQFSSPPLFHLRGQECKQILNINSLADLKTLRPLLHPPLSLLRFPLRLLGSLNAIATFDTRLVQSIADPYFTPTSLLVHVPLANGLSIPVGFAGSASAAINLLPIQRLSYIYGVASLTGVHRSPLSHNPSWSSNSSYHDDLFIPQHYASQCYHGTFTIPINAIQLGLKSVIPPHCMSLLTSYLKRPRYVHGLSSEMTGNCSQFDLFPLNVISSDEWENIICGHKIIDISFLKSHTTMKMTMTREQAEERDEMQRELQTIEGTLRDLGHEPSTLDAETIHQLSTQLGKSKTEELSELVERRHEIQSQLTEKEEQWQTQFQRLQEWFWKMLSSFDVEKRSSFLQFVWGVSKLPAIMTSQFNVTIVDYGSQEENDNRLPQSHTCFFLMELPMYSSYDTLVHQMTFALTSKDISF